LPTTVGKLLFADQGDAYTWSIASGTLTLDAVAGTPEINVSNQTATIGSILTGTQGLTKTGVGTLVLHVGNTFTGGLTVETGTVDAKGLYASDSALGSGAVTIWSGATVTKTDDDFQEINGDLRLMGGTLAATGTPNDHYGNFFLMGNVIHAGDVQSVISARLHMRNTHEFSVADGAAAIDLLVSGQLGNEEGAVWGHINKTGEGTMEISHTANLIGGLAISAGKVILQGALPGFEHAHITNDSALEINIASDSGTFIQGISGSGTFTKTGAGTLILTASNTYVGATTISEGTLEIGGAGVLAATTTVSITGTLAFNSTASQTLTNGISGESGILTKANTGTLTLNGANTYTGATMVSGGRLNVNNAHASSVTVGTGATLGGTGSMAELLTLNEGSTLALDGTSTTASLTSNGVCFSGATSLVFDGTPVDGVHDIIQYGAVGVTNWGNLIPPATFRAIITDDAPNQKLIATVSTGTRTWNTTSGTWEQGAGTNFEEGDQMFYTGDAVVFNDPATASTITLSGALSPVSVTFNHANDYLISGSGSITGFATLTKNGTGTLTLSGSNAHTGVTTVNGGALIVNGSLGTSEVTVASTATLGGTGTLGGNVIFSSGALACFTQGSPLTISGTLTLNDNVVHLVLPADLALGTYPLASYNLSGSTGAFAITPLIDSGSLVTDAVAVITTVDGTVSLIVSRSSYDGWKNDTFANGTLSDKTLGGDPDGDQHSNLVEFAFDTDPTVSSSSSIAYTAEGGITAAGEPVTRKLYGDYYAVFGRRLDHVAAGLTYTVEFSADLDVWVPNDDILNAPVPMCAANATIDAMGVKFPLSLNFNGVDRNPTFFRVKVVMAP
jgi:fibronectin-binding autotransporter adhesin